MIEPGGLVGTLSSDIDQDDIVDRLWVQPTGNHCHEPLSQAFLEAQHRAVGILHFHGGSEFGDVVFVALLPGRDMGEVILEGIEYGRIIALDDIAHIQLIYLHRERHLGPERVDVAVEEYLPSWRLVGRQRGAFWDFQKLVSLGDEIVSETDMTIEKIPDFLDRCEAVVTAAISASSTTS